MKIRSVTTTMVSLVAIGLLASGNAAAGLTADKLEKAGYICFNDGPSNFTHCLLERHLGNPVVPIKVLTEDGQQLLGTEQLLREDRYRGQPCPQGGLDMWEFNADIGYFACHHFET